MAISVLLIGASIPSQSLAAGEAPHQVTSLKVTILSTMLAEKGIGEWGFAALVEADGHRILFDTGKRPDTVLINAGELGIDLSDVTDVVLSHNHGDHTGGLLTLRRHFLALGSDAMSKAHVAEGIFWERPEPAKSRLEQLQTEYNALGGGFVVHHSAAEIRPGIWLTGPVPRVHDEKNYPSRDSFVVKTPSGMAPDTIPESMSLVINTPRGLVVISGCGHAGIINTLEYSQKITGPAAIHAAIGGFHLAMASDEALAWTAGNLEKLGVENFIGAHCTGLEPVYRFRLLTPLERSDAVVGAVGASFSLESGIDPLYLAK
jgi:7,8-dihydropterin-6-yl-methyl-4-(beta-D-ribofuranosyl)aminobenzene 5'-phosphate synthase